MSETQEQTREREYHTPTRGRRRTVTGIVVSTKMAKTLVVQISRTEKHKKYHKYIRQHSKVYAHDAKELAKVGDEVKVMECRPLSKTKRFTLLEVTRIASSK
jgi:small subunit ribosomal protein S17